MNYKVGDRVWWSEYGMKLLVTRVNRFKSAPYACVDCHGVAWNWFKSNELKPIIRVKNGVVV